MPTTTTDTTNERMLTAACLLLLLVTACTASQQGFQVTPLTRQLTTPAYKEAVLAFKILPWTPPRSNPEFNQVTLQLFNDTSNQLLCEATYKWGEFNGSHCTNDQAAFSKGFSDVVRISLGASRLWHIGSYTLTIQYADGRKSDNATQQLQVLGAPLHPVVLQPPAGVVQEGDYVWLNCTATGANPPAQLAWSRGEGGDLQHEDDLWHLADSWRSNSSLDIRYGPVGRQDHGKAFICRAWNHVNEHKPITRSLSIEINYAPFASIDQCPLHDNRLHVIEGHDAAMTPHIDANPNVTHVAWYGPGSEDPVLDDVTKNRSSQLSVGVTRMGWELFVFDVNRSMTGSYRFEVNSPKGSYTALCKLDVLYPPEVKLPAQLEADEGSNLTIACLTDAKPHATSFIWSKDDVNVGTTLNLELSKLQPQDAGVYTCTAFNELKPSLSTLTTVRHGKGSVHVLVNFAPEWLPRQPRKFVADPGSGVTLACEVEAYPAPVFQWMFGKKVISSMANYVIARNATGSYLHFRYVQEGDYGEYKCNVYNKKGTAIFPIELHKPGIPDRPEYCIVVDRTSSSLAVECACPYSGGAEVNYVVHVHHSHAKRLESQVLVTHWSVEAGVRLNISHLQPSTSYGLTIYSDNVYGRSERAAFLHASTSAGVGDSVSSGSHFGAKVGLVMGILVVVLTLVASVVYVYSRGSRPKTQLRQDTQLQVEVYEGGQLQQEQLHMDPFTIGTDSENELQYDDEFNMLTSDGDTSNLLQCEVQPHGSSTSHRNQDQPEAGFEVASSCIQLQVRLAGGSFSEVWQASLQRPHSNPCTVTAKVLREDGSKEERQMLLAELEVLKMAPPHRHIIALLACHTQSRQPIIILQLFAKTTLLQLLRNKRASHLPRDSLTLAEMTVYALQVVSGLSYLQTHGWIHADLACRSVQVDDQMTCKLTDFGHPRDVSRRRTNDAKKLAAVPVRWMAPESLYDCIYTTASDIWSVGVLLWEILSIGSTPYPGMQGADVMERIQMGYRMPRLQHCPDEWFDAMYGCWTQEAAHRPTALTIQLQLERCLQRLHEGDDVTLQELRGNMQAVSDKLQAEIC